MALTQISTDGVKNDAISHNKIPANAIQASELADNAVDTAAIANGAVTTTKINASAVVTDSLATDAVTGAKIADNAIDSEHYTDGSIDTAHIGTGQVTGAKLAAGAVSEASKIADSIITGAKIGSGTIAAGNIASNAVTTAKIADQAVTLDKLPHGTSSNDGKFLRANNGADPSFETVSIPAGTTISGNANNRIITGSDTANTLNADADVTYDAATSDFSILGSKPGVSMDLIVQNNGGGNAAGARLTLQSGNASNTGPQFGMLCNGKSWYLQTPKNVGALDFHGNGTRTFRLLEDGHVEISNGDLTLGTNGHGIDFYGGSGSYRQAANTLDDYEEGTFTPNIQDAASGGNSHGNSGVREAKYTKVGNTVTVMMNCRSLSNSGLNGSHQIFVTNLPFRQSGVERAVSWSQVQYFNNVSNTEFGMHWQINANETIMRFFKMKDNQGANPAITFNHWMYSNGYYGFSTTFTYITDQ